MSALTTHQGSYNQRVLEETVAQVRTFLDELANGTANYGTTHSLNEQVEHQYFGRFAIELLQNAHDALAADGRVGRVEFCVAPDEGEHGVLYVANEGRPFMDDDFRALARLGQSAKNPEESVGNKGLGFRSVLEISTAPEIYSADPEGGGGEFRGFCFGFDPSLPRSLEPALDRLVAENLTATIPFAPAEQLVRWSPARHAEFKARLLSKPAGWLSGELGKLSPYLFPIPLEQPHPPRLQEYARAGYSTVVRLPIESAAAAAKVNALLEGLAADEVALLFLECLSTLSIRLPGETVVMTREAQRRRGDALGGEEIRLRRTTSGDGASELRTFWLWSRWFGGDEHPEEAVQITAAAAKLPGRWPQIRRARLSVAVERTENPLPGRYSIVLPTEEVTGLAAHLSGPFYGEIARRTVDFDQPLNALFLRYLARLVRDAARNLIGRRLAEAGAVLDLLAPLPGARQRAGTFLQLVAEESCTSGGSLFNAALVLTDLGWRSPSEVRILAPLAGAQVLTPHRLRKHAELPLVHDGLAGRYPALRELLEAEHGHKGELSPSERAQLVEGVARALRDGSSAPWTEFWRELQRWFVWQREALRSATVLLDARGRLHRSDGPVRVFFPPQRGTLAAAELERAIPTVLRKKIAFLSDAIPLYEPRLGGRGGTQANAVHGFLSMSPALVHAFEVEQILDEVVAPSIPALPAAFDTRAGEECQQIFRWTKQLLEGREVSSFVSKLGQIPVPAKGGWVRAQEAMFGPGWGGTVGEDLTLALGAMEDEDARWAEARLVLGPDDPVFRDLAGSVTDFLRMLGVVNGLRLRVILPRQWNARCVLSRYFASPPANPAPGFAPLWPQYRALFGERVRVDYSTAHDFSFPVIYRAPGLMQVAALPDEVREAYARVLLRSIGQWPSSWKIATLTKSAGERRTVPAPSPLAVALRELPWLMSGRGERRLFGPPRDFWHVKPDVLRAAGEHNYQHLRPLPLGLVDRLDERTVALLAELGLERFRPDEPTASPRLLEDLATAWADPKQEINRDRLVGQIREAWRDFTPEGSSFPSQLVLRQGRSHQVRSAVSTESFFLPDVATTRLSSSELETLAVLEINTPDARRLAGRFESDFGPAVRRLSELRSVVLVDGLPWRGAEGGGVLLRESDLGWLPTAVLAVAAYHGSQSNGTQTQRFRQAADRLQGARLVEVADIEIRMCDGDEVIAKNPSQSWWDEGSHILVVAREQPGWLESLSEPLGDALARADLEIPLRLLFVSLGGETRPTEARLLQALAQLGVDAHGFRAVQQAVAGELSWTLRRVRPLVQLLAAGAAPALDSVRDESELRGVLEMIVPADLAVGEVLDLCRTAATDREVGRWLHSQIGDVAELGVWNRVLGELGPPYMPVTSDAVAGDFHVHRLALLPLLRAVARHIARRRDEPSAYPRVIKEAEAVAMPADWPRQWWEVSFAMVANLIGTALEPWGAAPEVLRALRETANVDALVARLEVEGLEPLRDPVEIRVDNEQRCRAVLEEVFRIAIAWCARAGVAGERWLSGPDNLWTPVAEHLAREGYVGQWTLSESYAAISGQLPRSAAHAEFWRAADAARTPAELAATLGIDDADLGQAEQQLRRLREAEYKVARLVKVCGVDFDSDRANLDQLWSHIVGQLPTVAPVDLSRQTPLKPAGFREHGEREKRGKSPSPGGRLTQREKDLIGLAGEIHAYRALQAQYGATQVGPTNWVSRNREYHYGESEGNDELGFDFELHVEGRRLLIEVKATKEESNLIELGESEVREARKAVRARRTRYIILRVSNVLSSEPQMEVLPNPYDPKTTHFFDFDQAGVRLRYRRDR